MIHKNVTDVQKENLNVGKNTSRQVLISSKEAPNFALRKFTIEPGGFMPLHTNTVEHEQYVLNGKAEVQIGEEKIIVQKNDIVLIPKGVKHDYKTISNEPFEFLCIVPNGNDEITIIE